MKKKDCDSVVRNRNVRRQTVVVRHGDASSDEVTRIERAIDRLLAELISQAHAKQEKRT